MTVLKNIWTDLVEKRLWPVALILLVAMVGIPYYLSKPKESTAVAIAPPPIDRSDEGPTLSLSRVSTTGFARAPRVNDKRLDPFGARYDKEFEKALKAYLSASDDVISNSMSSGSGIDSGSSTPGGSGGSGGTIDDTPAPGGGGGGGGGGTDEPKASTPPKIEYENDDLLSVVIVAGEEAKELEDVRTLSPLPDTEDPFLVYVGKTSDGKASFLVSADVTVAGKGTCSPSPTDCRTLVLAVGDTAEFVLTTKENAKVSVTVTDVQRKKVPVGGDAATEEAAQLEAETRALGATALKSVVRDESVLESLVKNGVKVRAFN